MVSPTKLNRSMSGGGGVHPGPAPSGSSLGLHTSTPTHSNKGFLNLSTVNNANTSGIRTPNDKPGGPPIKGLFAATLRTPVTGGNSKSVQRTP